MAEITLKFDARNPIARKTIDYVLSLGIFTKVSGVENIAEKPTLNSPNAKTNEFYKMVALGTKQAKEIASGKRKGKPLQKVLNEL
ncbi:MAG: hypothetical protein WCY89_02955 [Flavobacteriaceae bacterium]